MMRVMLNWLLHQQRYDEHYVKGKVSLISFSSTLVIIWSYKHPLLANLHFDCKVLGGYVGLQFSVILVLMGKILYGSGPLQNTFSDLVARGLLIIPSLWERFKEWLSKQLIFWKFQAAWLFLVKSICF